DFHVTGVQTCALPILMYTLPRDPLEARFSLEYGLACILLTGRCVLADFEPDRVSRAEVRELYPRIHRHPVDAAEGEFPTEVEVRSEERRVGEESRCRV